MNSRRSARGKLAGCAWAVVAAVALAAGAAAVPVAAEEARPPGPVPIVNEGGPLIPVPQDPAQWPAFRERLAAWRSEARTRLRYDDALYRRADFAWAPLCYSCGFVMMCDETFYSREQGRFLVDSFLDHGAREFGGYDSIVLWHAYPRIGLDDRNQFDFYRDMPGGLAGLKELSRACHARGVRVFIDYNPWDTGTRREGAADVEVLAALVRAIDADGIFLDTMDRGGAEFRAALDSARPGVVLESELALPLESVHDHHMSWAQEFGDGPVPGILRNKWFERRHVQHQIRRWDRDHTRELHSAWMNGSGMMVWENVFGAWVGWNARDRSVLRAMLPVQRRYAALFSGEAWTPLVPTEKPEVFASLWEGRSLRLWTLVNRSEKPVEGVLLRVPSAPGDRYFDLVAGREVKAAEANGAVAITGAIRPRGVGAFVSGSDAALGTDFAAFLASQAALDARADGRTDFPQRDALLKAVAPTRKYRAAEIPAGMVAVPPVARDMKVVFRERECGFYESREAGARRSGPGATFVFNVRLAGYAIDLMPVTNAQFAGFLKASGYRPAHPENFLKHWRDGAPPRGLEDHPVVYVDLDDARAYAAWAGKRLPTEEEWQHAAEGPQALKYPWGNEMKAGVCNVGEGGGTTPVRAFPGGRSPFGCYDMCGNVWQWTESQRSDGRTRFAILRGGSWFQAKGSHWYADGGPQPCHFAAKMLLMWPGLDRCGTIGLRCGVDLASD